MSAQPENWLLEKRLVFQLTILDIMSCIMAFDTPNIFLVSMTQECGAISHAFLKSIQAIYELVLLGSYIIM